MSPQHFASFVEPLAPTTERRSNRQHSEATSRDDFNHQLASWAGILRRHGACTADDGNFVFGCCQKIITVADEIT